MLCNLFWLDNTLVKIHECLRVAHTQRNCRDHRWLSPAGKISRILWGIPGDFGCWWMESTRKFRGNF